MARMKNKDILAAHDDGAVPISKRPTRAILAGVATTRLLRVLHPLAEDIKAAQRKLLQECAEKDEKGNYVVASPGKIRLIADKAEHFVEEMNKLMEDEADVDVWVKPSHFDGVEVTGAELAALGPLLRIEDVEEEV